MINKKNLPLYAALAVPVLMILIVAGMVYLPGLWQKPKYNFLYMTGNGVSYDYYYRYTISGNRLMENAQNAQNQLNNPYGQNYPQDVHFYVYDVVKQQASELTLAQAEQLNLDSSNTSPDGYTVSYGSSGGGSFLFGAPGDYNNLYLQGHNRSRKLDLKLSGSSSYSNYRFLGWVK